MSDDYERIRLEDVHSFDARITRAMGEAFASLTGDRNPLHVDPGFGESSQFGRSVVHGMLVASLFSRLVGMHCPGRSSLYVSQSIQFRQPVFYDDDLEVRGTVTGKSDGLRLVTMKTEVFRDGQVVVDGVAKVKVLVA